VAKNASAVEDGAGMTEAEWNACSDPARMLDWMREQGRLSSRKARLLALGYCRHALSVFPRRGRAILEFGDEFADGVAGETDLEALAGDVLGCPLGRPADSLALAEPVSRCWWLVMTLATARTDELIRLTNSIADAVPRETEMAPHATLGSRARTETERSFQCELLRDLVTNPFRPPAWIDAWRTSEVVALATAIYEQRSFDLMPVLGAAISDAGCTDEGILGHYGGRGPHVRGCWVVDLLLKRT
jgi:hypothetical protein